MNAEQVMERFTEITDCFSSDVPVKIQAGESQIVVKRVYFDAHDKCIKISDKGLYDEANRSQ